MRTEAQKLMLAKAMLFSPAVRDRLQALQRPVADFTSPIDMSQGFKVIDVDKDGVITSFWDLDLEGDV